MGSKFNKKQEDKTNKTIIEKFADNSLLTIVIIILSLVLVGGIVYLIITISNKNKAQALDNFNSSQNMSTSVSDLPQVTDYATEVAGQYSDTSSMQMDSQQGEFYNKLLNSVTSDL